MEVLTTFAPNTVGAFIMRAGDYHAAPGVSNSSLRAISRSPLDYRRLRDGTIHREETEYMEYGQLFHSAVLENHRPVDLCYIQPDLYADGTKPWHNGAKECKAWREMRTDKPILSRPEFEQLKKEVQYVKDHPKFGLLGGWIELSCFAIDPVTGLMLKGRLDNVQRVQGNIWTITDLKTTQDASTDVFRREILSRKYHVQAAMYRRIWKLLVPDAIVQYRFMAVEKGNSIKVNSRFLAPQAMDLGDKIIDKDLETLARCQHTNTWPEWGDETDSDIDLPDFVYEDTEILTGMTATTNNE